MLLFQGIVQLLLLLGSVLGTFELVAVFLASGLLVLLIVCVETLLGSVVCLLIGLGRTFSVCPLRCQHVIVGLTRILLQRGKIDNRRCCHFILKVLNLTLQQTDTIQRIVKFRIECKLVFPWVTGIILQPLNFPMCRFQLFRLDCNLLLDGHCIPLRLFLHLLTVFQHLLVCIKRHLDKFIKSAFVPCFFPFLVFLINLLPQFHLLLIPLLV